MIAWFKKWFGRGSKVDLLVRALPNPPRVRAGVLAWAEATKAIGDRAGRWEPEDSLILDSLRQLADAADLLGPMVDGVVGADKRGIGQPAPAGGHDLWCGRRRVRCVLGRQRLSGSRTVHHAPSGAG